MTADRTHALLPWYVNGTLAPEEKDQFERHLETCPPCREDLEQVAAMRAEIARHGEAFFGEHPAPERLGALFGLGEEPIDPAEGEQIRRHLAVCASCNEESRWLMGTEPAGSTESGTGQSVRPGKSIVGSSPRWWAQPNVARLLAAAAVALLTMLATVFIPGPWRGGTRPGPVARGFLDAMRRAGEVPEVLLRPEHTALVLDLVSELTPSQIPARVEIVDAAGKTVLHEEGLYPAPGGAVFTLAVPRRDLIPGLYSVRLYGRTPGEPPTEFLFRIVAEAP